MISRLEFLSEYESKLASTSRIRAVRIVEAVAPVETEQTKYL